MPFSTLFVDCFFIVLMTTAVNERLFEIISKFNFIILFGRNLFERLNMLRLSTFDRSKQKIYENVWKKCKFQLELKSEICDWASQQICVQKHPIYTLTNEQIGNISNDNFHYSHLCAKLTQIQINVFDISNSQLFFPLQFRFKMQIIHEKLWKLFKTQWPPPHQMVNGLANEWWKLHVYKKSNIIRINHHYHT